MGRQPKEARSADDSPARAVQERVEPRSVLADARAHRREPVRIAKRANPDRDRRPADRPRPQRRPQGRDDVRRSEREAETKPGEPVSLAERAQDDRAARRQRHREALFAVEIGEGFVDDEQSPAPRQALMQREQLAAGNEPPVRVVGVDHDGDVEAVHVLESLGFDHPPAAAAKAAAKPP